MMRINTLLTIVMLCSSAAVSEEFPSITADGVSLYAKEGRYESLRAINGGTLRMAGPFVASSIEVDAISTIYVHGIGFGDYGYEENGSGGSHGGRGGGLSGNMFLHGTPDELDLSNTGGPQQGSSGLRGKPYRDDRCDLDVEGGYGGSGGGGLLIHADFVNIQGTVEANGGAGAPPRPSECYGDFWYGYGGGGGSGGCVLIVAKEMQIGSNAVITANGGLGASWGRPGVGYAGGGGRVKLFYETGSISPSARIEANAAPEWPEAYLGPDGTWFAADGTVYIQQVRSADVLVHPEKAGDLDGNGIIDSEDLAIFMSNWGDETTPAPTGKLVAPTKTPYYTATATYTVTPTRTITPTWTPWWIKTATPTPTQ